MSSIPQNHSDEKALIDCVQRFFSKHHVGKLLARCNGMKEKGVSPVSLFRYKLSNIFVGRSMYMQQQTGSFKEAFSKNTFYRFLNSAKTNWLRFTSLLAADIVNHDIKGLTNDSRKNVFIIDDSLFNRTSCKKTELGSKVFDHTDMRFKKGFRMLTLSWSDGNTLIPDLLKSEHADEYMKKYDEIRSYLKLNKDNPNVVSELDKKFAGKQFDGQYFDKELNTDKNRAKYSLLDRAIVNGESSLNLLTQENHKLARMMSKVFFPTDEMMKNGAAEDVANILISTNKKNAPLREELLGRFTPTIRGIDSDFSYEQDKKLKLLARLYDTIDADKNAKNFVRKSLPKLDGNFQLDEFVDILDNVSTKKLNIFRDNAWNIISKTTGKERINALNNNITDAFFETESTRLSNRQKIQYGYIKRRSLFKNMSIRIKNSLNKLRDAVTSDTQPKISTTTEVVIPKNIEKIEPKPLVQPEKFVKKSIYAKPEILPISRTAKREILKEKVISFVKKKLGEKTFSRQSDDFGKNATQIRLKMLPEIFASIADTRKVDRMIGKTKNQSSNKDVLTLYSKINGQNKKFVNYMLKKRNADNSRMFEVRDIIAILDKAENKIANNKKLNSDYRAKDAKAYYNHLFDAKVEQYGKLQRSKKTK